MPERHYLDLEFLSTVKRKIPHRATLTKRLIDWLAIDKDAIYRRLRGEVPFSFVEMVAIAKKLGISLDSIAGIQSVQSRPTQVVMTRHVNPSSIDYEMFNEYVDLLKSIKDEPNTLLMESGNALPHHLFYDYEHLTRIYLFGWNQASSFGSDLQFHDLKIPEQMRNLQKECCLYTRHIKTTHYVWDRMIFLRMVENIKFAARVNLIKAEVVSALKSELLALLDHLEKLADKGKHDDTGNQVFIYISDLYLETGYCCIKSKNRFVSLFKTFLLNSNSAFDEAVYNEVHIWINALQKMSTLISVSGERLRTEFFNTQREIIHTL